MAEDVWFSYQEAADYLHKSLPWLRKNRHLFDHAPFGRSVLFSKRSLDRYIRQHLVKAKPA